MAISDGVVDSWAKKTAEGTIHNGVGHGGYVFWDARPEEKGGEVIGEVVAVVPPEVVCLSLCQISLLISK